MLKVIRFTSGGGVRKLAEPADEPLYNQRPRRASRVEPAGWLRRVLFLSLRFCCGDNGRVAVWTRTWSCCWRARMFVPHRQILGPFASRDEALRAEQHHLLLHWIQR